MNYYSKRHFERIQERRAKRNLEILYPVAVLLAMALIMILVLKLNGWN